MRKLVGFHSSKQNLENVIIDKANTVPSRNCEYCTIHICTSADDT